MHKPLVSIIIPVYNSERFLAETIESAINQTWSNKEILLIDDGSNDNSLSIAKKYECAWIKVFHQENKGASAARNYGLREAKGEYIQFLDADDLLSNDKIEDQINTLGNSTSLLATCTTVHFNELTNLGDVKTKREWYQTGSNDPFDFLIKLYSHESDIKGYGGMVAVHSWLTPKALIVKAGQWNENLNVDDDGEYFCRVILACSGIKYAYNSICYYRHTSDGKSLSSQKCRTAYQSQLNALNLKYSHLKSAGSHPLLNQIMARHYWWTGVSTYPQYKSISDYCIQKAKALGFKGERYPGGKKGKNTARIVGWRITRILHFLKNGF